LKPILKVLIWTVGLAAAGLAAFIVLVVVAIGTMEMCPHGDYDHLQKDSEECAAALKRVRQGGG